MTDKTELQSRRDNHDQGFNSCQVNEWKPVTVPRVYNRPVIKSIKKRPTLHFLPLTNSPCNGLLTSWQIRLTGHPGHTSAAPPKGLLEVVTLGRSRPEIGKIGGQTVILVISSYIRPNSVLSGRLRDSAFRSKVKLGTRSLMTNTRLRDNEG